MGRIFASLKRLQIEVMPVGQSVPVCERPWHLYMLDGYTTMLVIFSTCIFVHCKYNSLKKLGPADIFRGIMVSLYVKGKENGHVQAYAPTGHWLSLRATLERKPVHDFPLPFTHRRSQNYKK